MTQECRKDIVIWTTCKVPLRVLGPSFAKIQDKLRNHDENSRQRKKKRDQIVFSPKLVLLDQALS